jgi:hypothetical protein
MATVYLNIGTYYPTTAHVLESFIVGSRYLV